MKRSREEDLETSSEPGTPSASDLSPLAPSPDSCTAPHSNSKIVHLDHSSENGEASTAVMKCSLSGHSQTLSFASFEDYETHYAQAHSNRCHECRKNFPTEHFLSLHIAENHDSLVAILREREEKTYACFVDSCGKKCLTWQKRKMHLINKHGFPALYDFFIVNDGIDHKSSMLRSGPYRHGQQRRSSMTQKKAEARRRSSTMDSETLPEAPQMVEIKDSPSGDAKDVGMEGLTDAMSSLKFIPTSVRFGRGRGRGREGFSRT